MRTAGNMAHFKRNFRRLLHTHTCTQTHTEFTCQTQKKFKWTQIIFVRCSLTSKANIFVNVFDCSRVVNHDHVNCTLFLRCVRFFFLFSSSLLDRRNRRNDELWYMYIVHTIYNNRWNYFIFMRMRFQNRRLIDRKWQLNSLFGKPQNCSAL